MRPITTTPTNEDDQRANENSFFFFFFFLGKDLRLFDVKRTTICLGPVSLLSVYRIDGNGRWISFSLVGHQTRSITFPWVQLLQKSESVSPHLNKNWLEMLGNVWVLGHSAIDSGTVSSVKRWIEFDPSWVWWIESVWIWALAANRRYRFLFFGLVRVFFSSFLFEVRYCTLWAKKLEDDLVGILFVLLALPSWLAWFGPSRLNFCSLLETLGFLHSSDTFRHIDTSGQFSFT